MTPTMFMTETTAKTAIITGGAGDIGKAIARRHIRDGGRVVLVDISADKLERAEHELETDSNQLLCIAANVITDRWINFPWSTEPPVVDLSSAGTAVLDA